MPYLIPNDWDGKNWRCVKLYWPNSLQWQIVLNGVLLSMTYGRNWDRASGYIKGAQKTGEEIWTRTYPYKKCDTCDEDRGSDQNIIIGCGGAVYIRLETLMSFITDITCEDGKLYKWYGPCCKILVEGCEGDTGPGSEGEQEVGYACNKARGMADQFATIMQNGMAVVSPTMSTAEWVTAWIAATPSRSWSQSWLYDAAWRYSLDASAIELTVASTDWNDYLACVWAKVIENTDGLTQNEFEDMQAAVATIPTIGDPGVLRQFTQSLMKALGIATFQWWSSSYYAIAATCTCPESTGYDGVLQFTGNFTTDDLPASQFSVEVLDNGRVAVVTWDASGDMWQSDDDLALEMTQSDDVTTFTVITKPSTGLDYPSQEWIEADCTLVSNWAKPWSHLLSRVSGMAYNELSASLECVATYGAPESGILAYHNGVRKCPNEAGDPKQYVFRYEITAIDGTPYG